jgi:AcrR family transcriptional regulator
MADTGGRVGRPRRADVADRVSEATVALVSERGYAATTLDAIAREAGAAKTTVYRRWESKAALATDVLAAQLGRPPVAADGAGVSTAVRWLVGRIRVPAIRLLLLGLVGEAARDRAVRDRLRTRIREPFTDQVADAWSLPRARVDLAFDVGVGTLLHRVAMTGEIPHADPPAVTGVGEPRPDAASTVSRGG